MSFFPYLENRCFILLCPFLLYSKVSQPYIYMYSLFFEFPSHLSHLRAWSRVPCAIQSVLIVQSSMYMSKNKIQSCLTVTVI